MGFRSSKKSDILIPHNYKARNSRHQSNCAGLTPGSPLLLLTAPGALLLRVSPCPGQGSPPVIDILLMCHNTQQYPQFGSLFTFLLALQYFTITRVSI